MPEYTYEESVRWMRRQPEYAELVEHCYLDEDNLMAAKRFAASEEFAAINSFAGLTKSRRKLRILDLGCGNGIAAYAFASLGHEVFATDPDNSDDVGLGAATRLAASVQAGSISTIRAFAEALPFAPSAFDLIYARQALHHFQDLRAGLAECARVLKRGGFLFATREHVADDEQQLKEFLAGHILHKLHGGEHAYAVEEYVTALESNGLKVLKCLAPYETVINHFPESNAQIKSQFHAVLERKYGRGAAAILARLRFLENVYRRRLSDRCNAPGRAYSFLCRKDG